jgi:hypothetical protein
VRVLPLANPPLAYPAQYTSQLRDANNDGSKVAFRRTASKRFVKERKAPWGSTL